ncbi:hypothetical protein B0H16DRAFT_1736836 [Mycena metata]|uniref:Uncharacterized protein n=1 Tax=Mycena metata TaxID=1033252 RepID=A0AAD7MNN3_9AGAR|nr:hypothetical protein B0H16DRAFT_1736836 [Mycena metata]
MRSISSSDADASRKRIVLYTMSAVRLFETAVVSPRHYRVVSHFLEFLAGHEPEEHHTTNSETSSHFTAVSDTSGCETDAYSTWSTSSSHDCASDIGGSSVSEMEGPTSTDDDVAMGAVRPVGFNDLPPEIGLEVIRDMAYIDKSNLSMASLASAAVVSESLRTAAARILLQFGLRFPDIRLMLTATGSLICGSAVSAIFRTLPLSDAEDLNFATASGQGPRVVDFIILGSGYKLTENKYNKMPGIARSWSLRKGTSRINILESVSTNALDVVTFFHTTCVYGAWTGNGLWHGYPAETSAGITITTRSKFPLRSSASSHRSMWTVLHKYMDRGFTIMLNEYAAPHRCGTDLNCPATLRTSDDAGCSYTAFPDWHYTSDAVPHHVTCWSMGGTGCPQGILHRPGGAISSSTAVADDRWKNTLRLFMNSSVAPDVDSFGASVDNEGTNEKLRKYLKKADGPLGIDKFLGELSKLVKSEAEKDDSE